MTTPDGLTAESEVLLTIISERLGTLGTSNAGYHVEGVLDDVRASLPHIEAAAVARHVRETGCEALEALRPRIEDSDGLSLALRGDGRWQAMLWLDEDPLAEADGQTIGEALDALAALAASPEDE